MASDQNVERTVEPFRSLLPLSKRASGALDEAFANGTPGRVPAGRTEGIGLGATGTPLAAPLAWLFRLVWRGKVFAPDGASLVNRLPFGVEAIAADVYEGPSAFDGKPCIVIDYARRSLVARMVRDEIRQIEPGVHLGLVFVFGRRVLKFALREG